jgi:glycosyltransferase involved in cell wall biosynthesis
MKLICNLSMLYPEPTGLGVYSENCVTGLAERFDLDLIAGSGKVPRGDVLMKAPESIAIGQGKYAWLRRYLWTRSLSFGSDRLVYTPTQHGLYSQSDQIITVHDLNYLHVRKFNYFPQIYIFFRFLLPGLLKKCRAVFTVSETTRQDIFKTYGYPLEKIYVVPNGVDTTTFRSDPSKKAARDPYLMMVGGRHPVKNVLEVLDMAECWKRNYRLILASHGQGRYQRMVEKKVLDLGLSDRVEYRGYLTHDELVHLYQGATALVYPSLIEGFGIPPIEALACGTPVIVSDIPVFREVLGEAAQFVKLGNHQSWTDAINSLSDSSVVKNNLSDGQKVLSRFTWNNAVDALERALLSVEPRLEDSRRNSGNC